MQLNPSNAEELRARLNEGTVSFAFKKIDGSLRTAVGTTSLETIPVDHHPNGNGEFSNASVPYFDIAKNEWRSVAANQEIYIG